MGDIKRSVLFIIFIFTAGACAAGMTGYVRAGTLDPDSSPAPTMKTLDEVEPRIPISALPYPITESGSYYLTGNMDVSGDGITVEADDVTIDLMGYTITGDGSSGYGIYINGRSNVEIRNGTVKTFGQRGIYEPISSEIRGNRIISIRVVENGSYGIFLSSTQNQVKNCTASGNIGTGIFAGTGSTVTNNTAYDNGSYGFSIGLGSTVINNTAYDNASTGISADYGSTVTGNTAHDNGGTGIYAYSGSTMTNNTAYLNAHDGIKARSSCTVTNNTAYDNGNFGIYADYGNTVTNNTARDNASGGIATSYGSTVTINTAYANDGDGITTGPGSTITNNTARYNQNYGIYISGDSLVKDNTATSNNQSGGAFTNLYCYAGDCTMGTNHAP